MTRISAKTYQRRTLFAMSIYIALLLIVFPLAREAANMPLKACLALVPVTPVMYVIWLMARRIWQSDELEQRTHLIGLGAATGAIAVISLISGFLAAAKVLTLDACAMVLLWVFPVLVLTYSGVRAWVGRHYGLGMCDDEDAGMALNVRFFVAAAIFAVIAAFAYFRHADEWAAGVASGMAAAMISAGIFFAWRHRVRRRRPEPVE